MDQEDTEREPNVTCRLEKQMAALLERSGIDFTRPDQNRNDPTTLDFFLPQLNIYIEVKQYHSDRINRQLSAVPERTTAILLMGPAAVGDLERLCNCLKWPTP